MAATPIEYGTVEALTVTAWNSLDSDNYAASDYYMGSDGGR